jgi:hypothetical protein
MYYDNSNELIDLIDLVNFTLHNDFIEKWKYKYSEKFLSAFQYKLLDSLSKRKPLTILSLKNFFMKKLKYSEDQIDNFFESIEIELYTPILVKR